MSGINKPPYKIPSMKEIEQIPWNGFNVVSTFSGGGGSCLGYRMAGYKVLWANEFVEEAQKTYRANHPDVFLDTRDIRTIKPEEILEQIGLKKGQLDLFDGSPPCCAFSTAGQREKAWGMERSYSDGKVQKIEDLFGEYIRILNGLQPKVFVAENVSGMVKGTAIGYFKEYLKGMKQCGYDVKCKLLNSKWLGVPQARERVIFIGVRKDIGIEPVHPKPLPYYYTVGDAFKGIKNSEEEVKYLLDAIKDNKTAEVLKKLPINPKHKFNARLVENGSWFSLWRISFNDSSPTIIASDAIANGTGLCHPLENRKLTTSELKRLTSLPDDFVLTGNLNQQRERMGRMVPPVMMMQVAKTIEREILCKTNLEN